MRHSAILGLSLAVAVPAAAQPNPYPGPVEQHVWHTAISGAATFSQTTSGLLTGAGYPDVVVLQAGVPHILGSPAALNELMPIPGAPSGCTSVAALFHELSQNGYRRDQLVVSTPTGLRRWARTASPQWADLASQLTGSGWANLEQLLVADVDADGREDLVGLDGGGTVRVCLGTATGFGTVYSRTLSDVLAVATTAWDTGSGREVAIATASGLVVYSHDLSSQVAAIAGTSCSSAILASPRAPGTAGGEVLVLAAATTDGDWSLFNVTSTSPPPIALGTLDLVAAAVGDIDADGDDDVIFSKRSNHRATLFVQNQPTFFTYYTSTTMEVPLIGTFANWSASAGAAPSNGASPVLVDFDGNGAADLLVPVESTKMLAVVRSPFGAPRAIELVSATSWIDGELGDFRVELGLSTSNWPATATHVEWVAWWMDLQSNELQPIYALEGVHDGGRVAYGTTSLTISLHESGLLLPAALLVQVRPIRIVTQGDATTVGPVWRPTTALLSTKTIRYPDKQSEAASQAPYLASLTSALGCHQGSWEIGRLDGPSQLNGTGNSAGSHEDGAPSPGKGKDGGVGPQTNGGVETGEIIIVEPPPPPDPPSGNGTGAGGSGPG